MQIALAGAAAGFVLWLMTMLVKQVILVPLFCGDANAAMCLGAPGAASSIATILAGVVGLMGLVRVGAYRPLLIVIAALISLWGLGAWTSAMPWYTALAWAIIMYGLAYVAFAWFARIRPFVPALVVVVIVLILSRIFAVL